MKETLKCTAKSSDDEDSDNNVDAQLSYYSALPTTLIGKTKSSYSDTAASPPQRAGEDEEEEYVVDRILDKRTREEAGNVHVEYFLSWKGFDA